MHTSLSMKVRRASDVAELAPEVVEHKRSSPFRHVIAADGGLRNPPAFNEIPQLATTESNYPSEAWHILRPRLWNLSYRFLIVFALDTDLEKASYLVHAARKSVGKPIICNYRDFTYLTNDEELAFRITRLAVNYQLGCTLEYAGPETIIADPT